jgi:hypothetical protein
MRRLGRLTLASELAGFGVFLVGTAIGLLPPGDVVSAAVVGAGAVALAALVVGECLFMLAAVVGYARASRADQARWSDALVAPVGLHLLFPLLFVLTALLLPTLQLPTLPSLRSSPLAIRVLIETAFWTVLSALAFTFGPRRVLAYGRAIDVGVAAPSMAARAASAGDHSTR